MSKAGAILILCRAVRALHKAEGVAIANYWVKSGAATADRADAALYRVKDSGRNAVGSEP